MIISEYSINGYWWYSIGGYWWLLMAIISMAIGGYSIDGYFVIGYLWLLVVIVLVVINEYSIMDIGGC